MDSLFLGKNDAFSLIGDRYIQFVVLFRHVFFGFVMGYCSERFPTRSLNTKNLNLVTDL